MRKRNLLLLEFMVIVFTRGDCFNSEKEFREEVVVPMTEEGAIVAAGAAVQNGATQVAGAAQGPVIVHTAIDSSSNSNSNSSSGSAGTEADGSIVLGRLLDSTGHRTILFDNRQKHQHQQHQILQGQGQEQEHQQHHHQQQQQQGQGQGQEHLQCASCAQVSRLLQLVEENVTRLGGDAYTAAGESALQHSRRVATAITQFVLDIDLEQHQATMQQALREKKACEGGAVKGVARELSGLKKELQQVRDLMAQSTQEQTAVVMSIMAQMQKAAASTAAPPAAPPAAAKPPPPPPSTAPSDST